MEWILLVSLAVVGGVELPAESPAVSAEGAAAPLRCEDFGTQMDECLMAAIPCTVDANGNCITPPPPAPPKKKGGEEASVSEELPDQAPLRCEDFGTQMDDCLMSYLKCKVDDKGNCVTP